MKGCVWKFDIQSGSRFLNRFNIRMPKGARVISVGLQGKDCEMVWAFIPSVPVATNPGDWETRRFVRLLTGEFCEHDDNLVFIGTFLHNGGSFVVHLFEEV